MAYVLGRMLAANKQHARRGAEEASGTVTSVSRQLDPCQYTNDGSCDVPKYCAAGDYADCSNATPDRPCSLAELQAVAKDPTTAIDVIDALLKTNPPCGNGRNSVS